jgi:5-methylcytosine-specific restriction endonuclease McrA
MTTILRFRQASRFYSARIDSRDLQRGKGITTVGPQKPRLTIRASSSRLVKGLLAIPQKYTDWFPAEKVQIQVVFDDEDKTQALTFHPYDPTVKESRIFGLARWFSKRSVNEGDLISITLEDPQGRLYRIALDRYVRERQEEKARRNLQAARTDSEASQELDALSRLTRRRPREVAKEELLRVAQQSVCRPRPRVSPSLGERHEGLPSGIRVLLRELHDGKCQLCSFTFEKRNGEPYFEVHHLDPEVGHHPSNLLVVCPNCHAQFEHATVTDFKWVGSWLVGVTINGKRVSVRQPLAHDSIRRTLLGLVIVVGAAQVGRLMVR